MGDHLNIKDAIIDEKGVISQLFCKRMVNKKTKKFSYLIAISKKELSEEEKKKMLAKIIAKLKAGQKLSREEMEFLRVYDPALYTIALRVQLMADALEEQLKHARSKQEANDIMMTSFGLVSKDDPAKEYIQSAFNKISEKFHRSGVYNKLPATNEQANKSKQKQQNGFKGRDEDEESNSMFEQMDLAEWSPLDEIIEALPKFDSQA